MSMLNCEIYHRGTVSKVADTELLTPTNDRTPYFRPPGSISGVGRVRRKQINTYLHPFKIYLH